MTTAVRTPPNHDNLTCYTNYRCRLPECEERARAYDRARRAAHATGQWQSTVDADTVREHIQTLAEKGISIRRTAELAGVGVHTLHALFQPVKGTRRPVRYSVRATTAEKVLAVTPDVATPPMVDPTGTARRIQALVANGWPMAYLGPHIGVGSAYVSAISQRSSNSDKNYLVKASTAAAVAEAYQRLATARPERNGVGSRQRGMARSMAASRGWPPTRYWADRMDLIDDPEFEPEWGISPGQIIADEARFLMEGGLDIQAVAGRLHRSYGYITEVLRDFPPREAAA